MHRRTNTHAIHTQTDRQTHMYRSLYGSHIAYITDWSTDGLVVGTVAGETGTVGSVVTSALSLMDTSTPSSNRSMEPVQRSVK